MRDDGG
jgi:hypothetical protein